MKDYTAFIFAAWLITAMLLVKINTDKKKEIAFLKSQIEKRDSVNVLNVSIIDSIQSANAEYSAMFYSLKEK